MKQITLHRIFVSKGKYDAIGYCKGYAMTQVVEII